MSTGKERSRSPRLQRQAEWSAQEQKNIAAETVEGSTPLSESEAKTLDRHIVRMVDATVTHMDKLWGLFEPDTSGQIHAALGFASWTAYVKDRVQGKIAATDREERKALVAIMSGRGMSQPAIASSLGVSKKTCRTISRWMQVSTLRT